MRSKKFSHVVEINTTVSVFFCWVAMKIILTFRFWELFVYCSFLWIRKCKQKLFVFVYAKLFHYITFRCAFATFCWDGNEMPHSAYKSAKYQTWWVDKTVMGRIWLTSTGIDYKCSSPGILWEYIMTFIVHTYVSFTSYHNENAVNRLRLRRDDSSSHSRLRCSL